MLISNVTPAISSGAARWSPAYPKSLPRRKLRQSPPTVASYPPRLQGAPGPLPLAEFKSERKTEMKKIVSTSRGGHIGPTADALANRDRHARSKLTVDELIDLGHSNFEAITRKTIEEVPVYAYRFADLPIELSGAEVLANSLKRLSPAATTE